MPLMFKVQQRFGTGPLPLLLATGGLLGVTFPLSKLAREAGVAPTIWAFIIAAGTAAFLSPLLIWTRRTLPMNIRSLCFYGIAGLVSNVIPNVLVFTVIPKLGAGFTAILFTLSPIFTLIFATVLRMRRPTALGTVGIGLGFVGSLLIIFSKGQIEHPSAPIWIGLALLIPITLACGNIYRTLAWPTGQDGLTLAIGTNIAAALVLAAVLLVSSGKLDVVTVLAVPWLILAQVIASGLMFSLFFRLQHVGGPVYLSQIGYVAATVGLAAGAVLGERYGFITWLGAFVVACGVALTSAAQR